MIPVTPYPLLRLAFFFTAGIGSFILNNQLFPNHFSGTICILLLFLFVIIYLIKFSIRPVILGMIAYLTCFFLGFWISKSHTASYSPHHLIHQSKNISAYIGVVEDELVEKKKTYVTGIGVSAVKVNDRWIKSEGKVLVYIPKSSSKIVAYGKWLLIRGSPKIVSNYSLSFDYKQYLSYKNIYHQHFINSSDIIFLDRNSGNYFINLSYEWRHKFTSLLKEYVGKGEEFAVASMLVLGVKQTLETELLNAYATSGTMHLLAISGFHVGLLFAFLQLLLKKLTNDKYGRHLFYLLGLLFIWCFGFFTAFSPSVLRAVVMFSITLLGDWMRRKGNIYNTIGSATLIILFFSPYMLMDIGFQMSFLAVFGIAYINPRMTILLTSENKIFKFVWEIICTSVSAQVFTFPLSLYYFKQFPTYFIFTNLWAVPLSTVILYVGISFFIGSFSIGIKTIIGSILKFLVAIFNKGMVVATFFPLSVIKVSYLLPFELLLLFILISSAIVLMYLKKAQVIYFIVTCAILFAASRVYTMLQLTSKHNITLNKIKGQPYISIVKGKNAKFLLSSSLFVDKNVINQLTLTSEIKGIKTIHFAQLPEENFKLKYAADEIVCFQTEKIGVINDKYNWVTNRNINFRPALIKADSAYIILSTNSDNAKLSSLSSTIIEKFEPFILDILPNGKFTIRN